LEQRLLRLEAEADRPLPDFDALRSNLDQWVNARLAQLQADLQSMAQSLPPRLESLRQDLQSARSAQADQAARFEQWGGRLDTCAEELARVSRDVQSIWSARVEWENLMEQRMDQHIKQRLDALDAAGQAATPAAGGAALQAEVAKLRERVSDARLREMVEAALDKSRPAGDAGGHAEVARLQGRVRLLTIATAVGGALLLAMLGMTLSGG
jgi:chromosome segregation ATPase